MRSILSRSLDRIERIGNKLPDPITLFVLLSLAVIGISWILATLGVSVTHPADQRVIAVDNLLSSGNIRRMLTDMVKNFAAFPPLGMVLSVIIGIGIAERSGLIDTALKRVVTAVPPSLLTATLVFAGVMSSMAADAGYIVLVPLGAVLYAGFGRHPLAGMAAAFAGVSGGFSANLLLTSLDPLLAGLSTTSAQLVDPNYTVNSSANYYFMIVSTFLITTIGAFVTSVIVEPRLGTWQPPESFRLERGLQQISARERKGLRAAFATFVAFGLIVLLLVLPENAILRDEQHGLKPFYESLVPLIMLSFLFCGLVYGWVVGTVKSDKDVVGMVSEYMGTMGSYIVLSFFAAQFIAYFSWSNLGMVVAVAGADSLKAIGFSGLPLILCFIVVTGVINLFIGSASAKWAIMGPVFVPMLMLMGYSPELVQVSYRIGDSITNIISPLLPYFPIIIAFAKRYDPRVGIGTLISTMLPYSIAFGIAWSVMLAIWMLLSLPLGPESIMFYAPAQ